MTKTKDITTDEPTDVFLNLLVHTARIIVAGTERVIVGVDRREADGPRGEHPRAEEYARSIDQYRVQWSGASEGQQKDALRRALKIHDMSGERIDAAVAALEG